MPKPASVVTDALVKTVRFNIPESTDNEDEQEEKEKEEKEEKEESNPEPDTSNDNTEPTQSWCFVGEDMSGRYCVKVPSDAACPSNRLFKRRGDCEYINAMHMPAGITAGGLQFRPLESMNFSDDSRNRKA